jgi:hypothetical protein
VATLKAILDTLDGDLLLNDGATTWSVDGLREAVAEAERDRDDDETAAEYRLHERHDGRVAIHCVGAGDVPVEPPVYVQVAS